MAAEQAEVVGQNMPVQFVAELSAQGATADAPGQAAEDGSRHGAEGDPEWASHRSDAGADLTTGQGGTDTTRSTANGANGRRNFHSLVEGRDFG